MCEFERGESMGEGFGTILALIRRTETATLARVRIQEWEIWGELGGMDKRDEPDQDGLDEFCEWLRGRLRVEGGTAGAARAIELARNSDLEAREYSSKVLRYQLALRAVDPYCIKQGDYGFCGPASLLFDFARQWPVEYVQCAVALNNWRVGKLMTPKLGKKPMELKADPDYDIRYDRERMRPQPNQPYRDPNQYWLNGAAGLGPADFLMLHAIRRAAQDDPNAPFDITRPGEPSQATDPSAMCTFLRRVGYDKVEDNTLWKKAWGKVAPADRVEHVRTCAALTRQGALVILLVNPWLSDEAMPGSNLAANPLAAPVPDPERSATRSERAHAADPVPLSKLHWIAVRSLSLDGDKVWMTFMNTGLKCQRSYRYGHFEQCYYGYVTGKA